jgi:mannan endo-1,4-beta-mannosidase
LNYFDSLGACKTKRVLSGQFTDFGERASLRLLEETRKSTGEWPALMGVDYADFPHGSVTSLSCNKAAIEYCKQGGIVTVGVHLYNPANPKGGGLRDKGVDLVTLLTEGETHERWMRQLDQLAAGLQELKDAGVVVLWRPFHEMNGGWFWWGAQPPEQFIKVWRHMFEYFSTTKKLDNLLWVYGPNHGQKTAAYYAGDNYVDIVGLDAYTDFIDPEHIRGYAEVAALPKPFGFTEFGPHGPQNPPGDYDYLRFIKGIQTHFPKTVFFMSWNGKWSLARNLNVKDMLANPTIVNRDDLPADLTGGSLK